MSIASPWLGTARSIAIATVMSLSACTESWSAHDGGVGSNEVRYDAGGDGSTEMPRTDSDGGGTDSAAATAGRAGTTPDASPSHPESDAGDPDPDPDPVRLRSLECPPGSDSFSPRALSADGTTVVGQCNAGMQEVRYYAVSWSLETGVVALAREPAEDGSPDVSGATAVSADGQVVVLVFGWRGHNRWKLWSREAPAVELPIAAFAVSPDGTFVVGETLTEEGVRGVAAYWTRASVELLGALPHELCEEPPCEGPSYGSHISADGSAVIGNSDVRLFRWTRAHGLQELPIPPPGPASRHRAIAVNEDGSVVLGKTVGPLGDPEDVWRWSEASGFELLPLPIEDGEDWTDLGGKASVHGTFVFASVDTDAIAGVVVWDEQHGLRKLGAILAEAGIDTTGWEFHGIIDTSPDGKVITGRASLDGRRVAFIADLR